MIGTEKYSPINALYLGNPKVRTIFIIQNLIINYNTTCLTTQIILFGGMHVLPGGYLYIFSFSPLQFHHADPLTQKVTQCPILK